MYFHAGDHLGISRVLVLSEECLPLIQLRNGKHIIVRQRKIKDIQILFHSFEMDGFCQRYNSPLNIPAEDHLCRAFPVLCSDVQQGFILKNLLFPFRKGRPRLHDDPLFL